MPPTSTSPADWFIDRDNSDSGLATFTSGNQVDFLIDGENYMLHVRDAINNTNSGDYIFLAGWRLDLQQQLVPGVGDSTVRKVMKAANDRGVKIFVLLSNHAQFEFKPFTVIGPPFRQINWDADVDLNKFSNTISVRDSRHETAGSAHQKFLVIGKATEIIGFCGGIDLALDRWDTPNHGSLPERQFEQYRGGWHDIGCEIRGPACIDLDMTFRERWDDPRPPRALTLPPDAIPLPTPAAPPVGQHHVQVLRTYACDTGYPFARRGEFSLRAAWLKAVSMAVDFIYIEDQYFVSYEFADALIARLNAVHTLRVIILLPEDSDEVRGNFNFHQNRLIDRLKLAAPNRVGTFHLINRTAPPTGGLQIYVHAKKMIVDDLWVGIGSMNLNRRSMTHDVELGVGIVDDEIVDGVAVFAKRLRLFLWAEHLGVPEDHPSLDDPTTGFAFWKSQAASNVVHATPHNSPTPRRDNRTLWNKYIDPQKLCSDTPRLQP